MGKIWSKKDKKTNKTKQKNKTKRPKQKGKKRPPAGDEPYTIDVKGRYVTGIGLRGSAPD